MSKPTDVALLVSREIRLMIDEMKDGCVFCNAEYICPKHYHVVNDIATNPRKYVQVKCINGQWKSKRLKEII